MDQLRDGNSQPPHLEPLAAFDPPGNRGITAAPVKHARHSASARYTAALIRSGATRATWPLSPAFLVSQVDALMKRRHLSMWLMPAVALLITALPATGQSGEDPKTLPPEVLLAEELTREEMAKALVQSLGGPPVYTPPPCVQGQEEFNDVLFNNPFCRWIEELDRRSITGGCGGGNYCPGAPVTRSQMAVFVVKAQFPEFVPAGLTLTGHWGFDVESADGVGDWGTSISYPVPMPTALEFQYREAGSTQTPECPGISSNPEAAPGFLCVYESLAAQPDFSGTIGNTRFGTNIIFTIPSLGDNFAFGTWAGTAPN